jgi:hypothetical protein
MNEINRLLGAAPKAEFGWPEFQNSESVFLWEAFVTSTAKGTGHSEDPQIAVTQFSKCTYSGTPIQPYSGTPMIL